MKTEGDPLKEYIRWAHDHRSHLDLKITNFNHITPIAPYVTFLVSLKVLDKTSFGSGIARNEELAFLTAVSEALERAFFENQSNLPTTSGIAVHTDPKMATIKAASEIIERDRFFCHYLTNTPVRDVTDNFFSSDTIANTVRRQISAHGMEFRLGEMRRAHGFYSVLSVCFIRKNPRFPSGGITMGLGCDVDLHQATEKAFSENIKSSLGILGQGESFSALNVDDFFTSEKPSILNHQRVSLQKEAVDNILNLFPEDLPSKIKAGIFIEMEEDLFSKIGTKSESLRGIFDCPLTASWADSPDLQRAFYGPTTLECLNMDRLEEFAGRPIAFNKINKFPHPFA